MTAPLSAPFPARVLRLLALALAFAAAALLPAPALHAQSVAIALSNLERTYTAAEAALDPETDILITPSESGPYTVTITYPGRRTAPRDVGAYPVRIVATSQANPALTATTTGTLVIAKAPLIATPNNQARLFGAPNSPLTLRYEGFLGADTERVLNRRPATTTPARTSSPAGDYAITATGGSDNNYTITLGPPATLTIVPAFPGTYEALLYPFAETETPSGKLTLTLPAAGTTFTGRLDLAELGTPLPLTGKLTPTPDLSGATAFAERRLSTGTTHRVEFTITPAGLSATLFTREPGDTENNPSSRTVDSPTRPLAPTPPPYSTPPRTASPSFSRKARALPAPAYPPPACSNSPVNSPTAPPLPPPPWPTLPPPTPRPPTASASSSAPTAPAPTASSPVIAP
jgi:hypothetical protein